MSVLVYAAGSKGEKPLHPLVVSIREALANKKIDTFCTPGVYVQIKLVVQLRFKGIKCHVVARGVNDKKPCTLVLNELLKAGLAEFEEPFDLVDTTKDATPSVEIRIPEDTPESVFTQWGEVIAFGVIRYLRSIK